MTPEQALAHPTWAMGPVITVNAATLVNKGLEVIEAHLLFGLDFDRIEVVVHPTSVVHSMVEFMDGSTMLQASPPTMAIPAVRLARDAGAAGGTAPAAYNAANETCVEAFLAGRLSFADIVPTVRAVLDDHATATGPVSSQAGQLSVDDVLAVDAWARERALAHTARLDAEGTR